MKKWKYILLLFIATAGCFFAACAKTPSEVSRESLSSPCNLHMDGSVLVWDEVENATGYIVYYQNRECKVNENRYDLFFLTEPQAYEIEVIAVGDGSRFCDSESVKFTYTIKGEEPPLVPTENLAYTLLEDGSGYEVSRGTADLTGVIVIPDTHESLPVKKVSEFAILGFTVNESGSAEMGYIPNTKTTGIHFPERLEEIGNGAFGAFQNLTEIEIPESVKKIESEAFTDCSRLKEVILHEGLVSIGSRAFDGCAALSEIRFPDTLQSVGRWALRGTAWMEKQPEGIVVKDNILLTYKENTEENLAVPSDVRLIAGLAFYGTNAVFVTVPDGTALSEAAFSECYTLETVVLPQDLKRIPDYAFFNCGKLLSIVLPESVTSIGKGAFSTCSALTSIEFPSSLETIGEYAFSGSGLTSVTVPEGVVLGKSAFYFCKNLKEVVIYSTETLPTGAFQKCTALESVALPEGTVAAEGAFAECTALTSVSLPSTLEALTGTFNGCTALAELQLPLGLKTIEGYAFNGCTALTELQLPLGLETIGKAAFNGCTALTEIVLPSSLKFIGEEAFAKSGLTGVVVLEGVKQIGARAFSECAALTEVVLPSSLEAIEEKAFQKSGLTSIRFPEGLKRIGNQAFYGCSGLTSVVLPESLTEIVRPFGDCKNLKELVLPIALASEMSEIKPWNAYFEKIYYKGTETEWEENLPADYKLSERVTVYFYAENEADVPVEAGHYWHYVDGIPTPWPEESV